MPLVIIIESVSGGSRVGGIRPWPPIEVGNGVCPLPLGGRKDNESSVNVQKFKVFDPPLSMLATGIPLFRTLHLKA